MVFSLLNEGKLWFSAPRMKVNYHHHSYNEGTLWPSVPLDTGAGGLFISFT